MKRKRIIPINAINLTVIITVMLFVAFLTQNVINELTMRDIQNVTRLTHTNIFTEIRQEMIEPINSSLIMAQNTLLLDFMDEDTPETEEKIAEYLTAIQEATGYESVFMTPDSTLNYYHPGGTDAKVDIESEHAYWYTNRIDAEDAYGFVVNTENLDNWALTIYVDANIKDRQGNFAGVAGVGKRITHLQEILSNYQESQGVAAYIVDDKGEIKVHEDSTYIKNKFFYDIENIDSDAIEISQNAGAPIEKVIGNKMYIIQYIPKLEWYLVVSKNASELTGTLNLYSKQVLFTIALGVVIMLLVTNYAISMYKKQIITLSNIDHLTDVPNRTIFEYTLEEAVKNNESKTFSLAIFDLDNLKKINDNLGHDKGDFTLKLIAKLAKETFKSPDLVSRIGGDEFAVIIYKPLNEARVIMEVFQQLIHTNADLQALEATVSIGITEGSQSNTGTTIYKRADEALYKSKNAGKDTIHVS